jgi:hypothetical protein
MAETGAALRWGQARLSRPDVRVAHDEWLARRGHPDARRPSRAFNPMIAYGSMPLWTHGIGSAHVGPTLNDCVGGGGAGAAAGPPVNTGAGGQQSGCEPLWQQPRVLVHPVAPNIATPITANSSGRASAITDTPLNRRTAYSLARQSGQRSEIQTSQVDAGSSTARECFGRRNCR